MQNLRSRQRLVRKSNVCRASQQGGDDPANLARSDCRRDDEIYWVRVLTQAGLRNCRRNCNRHRLSEPTQHEGPRDAGNIPQPRPCKCTPHRPPRGFHHPRSKLVSADTIGGRCEAKIKTSRRLHQAITVDVPRIARRIATSVPAAAPADYRAAQGWFVTQSSAPWRISDKTIRERIGFSGGNRSCGDDSAGNQVAIAVVADRYLLGWTRAAAFERGGGYAGIFA